VGKAVCGQVIYGRGLGLGWERLFGPPTGPGH